MNYNDVLKQVKEYLDYYVMMNDGTQKDWQEAVDYYSIIYEALKKWGADNEL